MFSLVSEVYGVGVLLCLLVDGCLFSEVGDEVENYLLVVVWFVFSVIECLSLDVLMYKVIVLVVV